MDSRTFNREGTTFRDRTTNLSGGNTRRIGAKCFFLSVLRTVGISAMASLAMLFFAGCREEIARSRSTPAQAVSDKPSRGDEATLGNSNAGTSRNSSTRGAIPTKNPDEERLVSAIDEALSHGDLIWSTRNRSGEWIITVGHTMLQISESDTTLLVFDGSSRIVAARPVMRRSPPEWLVNYDINVFPLQSQHVLNNPALRSDIDIKLVRGHYENTQVAEAQADRLVVLGEWKRDLAALHRR